MNEKKYSAHRKGVREKECKLFIFNDIKEIQERCEEPF